jgi:F420-non-reducing hydrogenase small subunit
MTKQPHYRFAMYWAAACGGCDISILNLHEAILDVADRFDIVFWPAVMDAKYADVEAMPEGSIDLTLFCGGIRTDENEHLASVLRAKSKVLVAYGSCATEGCIPGLANLQPVERMIETIWTLPGCDDGGVRPMTAWAAPEGELRIPTLLRLLHPLDAVVEVDYRVPGCPPESARASEVLGLLVAGLDGTAPLPPHGAVLGAGHSTVCDECRRDRGLKHITAFERMPTIASIDPVLCLLEQGLPCNGPATRDGCGAKCPTAGAPCIGCYGATDGVVDQGAKLLSAFASVVAADEPEAIERVLDSLPDPVGQCFRFGLARSLLRSSRDAWMADAPLDAREPALAGAATEGRR